MNKYKCISLYYFSGTGNTLVIAKETKVFFEGKGYSVTLEEMHTNFNGEPDESSLIGLIFPVAIQSTFPTVWTFVENMPEGKGQAVFMIDTMDAFSGGIVGPMKKLLVKKGYNCIGACELKMATSMQTTAQKVDQGLKKFDSALIMLDVFLSQLEQGKTHWRRIPFFSDMMRSVSKKRKIWSDMSRKLEVNHDQCIKCSLCLKHCPVDAISYKEDKITIDHELCIACMRCINYCPKNAFRLNGKQLIQKKTVKVDELKMFRP